MNLAGRKGLVLGVANKRSLAWAIAQRAAAAGAELALTFQGERLEENVRDLAATLERPSLIVPCDVTSDEQIEALFAQVGQSFGGLDFLVHGAAFAPRDALASDFHFVDTTREAFRTTLDISAYSLIALARGAKSLMTNGGSVLTLTYLGSQRVLSNYNVMGVAKAALESTVRYLAADLGPQHIRVNAISAGPVKTLAASGIAGFSGILQVYRDRSPLRRNTETSEVGDTGLFLLSEASRGITGEVLYVDGGFSIMGI
jgi:enoyl-[acyl-carrier protein] reductase I